jgi:hypothetical protein
MHGYDADLDVVCLMSSCNPAMEMGDHRMFDNVFVPPSCKAFLDTGRWPDKTVLVLEVCGARGKGSINQKGNYQGDLMGLEVHLRDAAHFPGKWAFFGSDDGDSVKMIRKRPAATVAGAHAVVDTTSVQFYPTLLAIATSKHSLSAIDWGLVDHLSKI